MTKSEDKVDDLTMYLYKTLGETLVSRETATEFARLLIKDRFGVDELLRQEPLTVADHEQTWLITGSGTSLYGDGLPEGTLRRGRAVVEISKADGQIFQFAVEGHILPLGR